MFQQYYARFWALISSKNNSVANIRNINQPFEPWIDEKCHVLILGSFPSIKAVAKGYYYGNPNNRFYNVLGSLLKINIDGDANRRKTILLSNHIAVHDVIESCLIDGSSDASIREVAISNIDLLIDRYSIRHIFLNGQTAGRLFDKHFPHLIEKRTILPSTSPANAKMQLDDLVQIWRQVLAYL